MLQRRFGQILVGVVGALGLILGLAGNAHAQAGNSASDESTTSVSIQNNNSGTGVSVSTTGTSFTAGTTTNNDTHIASPAANVVTPVINSNSTNDAQAGADKADATDTSQVAGNIQQANDSQTAVVAGVNDNSSSGSGTVSAAGSDTAQPTMTVVKSDGTTYQATKLVAHTGATNLASTKAVPAAASSSNTPPKPATPLLPQGAVADAPAQVAAAGRASGGSLPLAAIATGRSVHIVIILSLALTLLLIAGSFISQLRASGYTHAPRGATVLLSQFASQRSGFSMSNQLRLNPLFVESNRPVAAGWWVRGE